MSAVHHVATRHSRHSPPPALKKSALKSVRSGPASTSSSSHAARTPRVTVKGAAPSPYASPSTPSTSKSRSRSKSKHHKPGEDDDEYFQRFDSDGDDDMASTFLQYCAMCEKQIIVPNSSILYCSESCRRRDASTPPSRDTSSIIFSLTSQTSRAKTRNAHPSTMEEHLTGGPASKPSTTSSYPPHPHTGVKQARIPPMFHDGKPDLDPTEWKPADKGAASDDEDNNLPSSSASSVSAATTTTTRSLTAGSASGSWKPKFPYRPSSDASAYLAQFHHASSDSLTDANAKANATDASGGKPYATRSRTSAASLPTTALTVVTSGSGSSGTAATGDSPSTSSSFPSPSSSSTSIEDPATGTGIPAGAGGSAGKYSYGLHIFDRAAAFEKKKKTTATATENSATRPIKGAHHPAAAAAAASPFAPAARGSLKKLLSG